MVKINKDILIDGTDKTLGDLANSLSSGGGVVLYNGVSSGEITLSDNYTNYTTLVITGYCSANSNATFSYIVNVAKQTYFDVSGLVNAGGLNVVYNFTKRLSLHSGNKISKGTYGDCITILHKYYYMNQTEWSNDYDFYITSVIGYK